MNSKAMEPIQKISRKEYVGIHLWLSQNYSDDKVKCEAPICERPSKFLDFALRHGFKHDKKRENYMILCRRCHHRYDKEIKNGPDVEITYKALPVKRSTHLKIAVAAKQEGLTIDSFLNKLLPYRHMAFVPEEKSPKKNK